MAGPEPEPEPDAGAAMEALEARVLDEGALVTHRTLGRELGLSAPRARRLLRQFVEKHARRHQLSVAELVCSALPGGARCVLAEPGGGGPRDLFRHVYAVARASAGDALALAAAGGGFEHAAAGPGAVRGPECVRRARGELAALKAGSCGDLAASSSAFGNRTDKKVAVESSDEPKTSNGTEVREVKESPAKKPKQSTIAPKENKCKSNISNFFGKSDGQRSTKLVSKTIEKAQGIKQIETQVQSETKVECQLKSSIRDDNETNTIKHVENKLSLKKEVNKVTKKKSVIKTKNSKVDKKRKRVLHISDSEESNSEKDDPFAPEQKSDSDEDVIPPTPNNNVVKITSGIVNPKKRRKIVDKTYTTDDGYMVTKKEEVYESCSEDEVEMKENLVDTNVKKEILVEKKPVAVTPKKGRQKKIASPQKGKQASIMSFFKKK